MPIRFWGSTPAANDYVLKPFKFAVLLARIRAQLRQHEQSEDAVFAIGNYTFKPASKLLIDQSGSKIRLTEKETSILNIFIAPATKSFREMCFCTKFGVTTPA